MATSMNEVTSRMFALQENQSLLLAYFAETASGGAVSLGTQIDSFFGMMADLFLDLQSVITELSARKRATEDKQKALQGHEIGIRRMNLLQGRLVGPKTMDQEQENETGRMRVVGIMQNQGKSLSTEYLCKLKFSFRGKTRPHRLCIGHLTIGKLVILH